MQNPAHQINAGFQPPAFPHGREVCCCSRCMPAEAGAKGPAYAHRVLQILKTSYWDAGRKFGWSPSGKCTLLKSIPHQAPRRSSAHTVTARSLFLDPTRGVRNPRRYRPPLLHLRLRALFAWHQARQNDAFRSTVPHG